MSIRISEIGGALSHFRVSRDHAMPSGFVADLKRQAFCIRAVGQNGGILPGRDGSKDVGAHGGAVAHDDGHIPVDDHAVFLFSDGLHKRDLLSLKGWGLYRAGRSTQALV